MTDPVGVDVASVRDMEEQALAQARSLLSPEELERSGAPLLCSPRYPDDPVLQSAFTQFVFHGRDFLDIARRIRMSPELLRQAAEADDWFAERRKILDGERDAVANLLGRYCAAATAPYVTSIERARVKAQGVLEEALARAEEKGISPLSLSHLTKALKDVADVGKAMLELGTPEWRKAGGAVAGASCPREAATVNVNVAVLQSAGRAVAGHSPGSTPADPAPPKAGSRGEALDITASDCAPPLPRPGALARIAPLLPPPPAAPAPIGRRAGDAPAAGSIAARIAKVAVRVPVEGEGG